MKNRAALAWGESARQRKRWQQNNDKMVSGVKKQGSVEIYNSRVEN